MRKTVTLRGICEFRKGRKPNRYYPAPVVGSLPYILIENFEGARTSYTDDTNCVRCSKEDTLIVCDGARTGLSSIGNDGYIGSTIAALTPDTTKILPRFLFYFISSNFKLINTTTRGAAVPHIDKTLLMSLSFVLPSLAEQKRIVGLLDEAEQLRKLHSQASARIEEFVPALFHSMFWNFTKMTQLGDLVEEFRYGTSNKADPKGFPTLRIPNVIGQRVDLDDLKFVPVSKDEFKRIQLIDGDILFVRSNGNPDNIGRSAIFERELITQSGLDSEKFIYASYLIRARLRKEIINSHFLQSYLSTSEGRMEVKKRARTSAGQYNINTENLSTIPVPLPPLVLQREFAARVQDVQKIQKNQAKSSERIDTLFQVMIAKAFEGSL